MEEIRLRTLAFTVLIALLVWSSSFETCIARRGKHWRPVASASLTKKKTKNSHGGSGHGHRSGGGGSKHHRKAPSSRKSPLAPPSPDPVENTPKYYSPPAAAPPEKDAGRKSSANFNVMDFGAHGDGSSDDTKVVPRIVKFYGLQNL